MTCAKHFLELAMKSWKHSIFDVPQICKLFTRPDFSIAYDWIWVCSLARIRVSNERVHRKHKNKQLLRSHITQISGGVISRLMGYSHGSRLLLVPDVRLSLYTVRSQVKIVQEDFPENELKLTHKNKWCGFFLLQQYWFLTCIFFIVNCLSFQCCMLDKRFRVLV